MRNEKSLETVSIVKQLRELGQIGQTILFFLDMLLLVVEII